MRLCAGDQLSGARLLGQALKGIGHLFLASGSINNERFPYTIPLLALV